MKQTQKPRDWAKKAAPVFEHNDGTFTDEKGERAVEMYRSGMTLAQICSHEDMPSIRRLHEWKTLDPEFGAAWRAAKAEHDAVDRNSAIEYQVIVCEEIFAEYGTTSRALNKICKDSEHYPSYQQVHAWSQNNQTIRDMRNAAEQSKAVLLAEEAMELADGLEGANKDPRAAALRVRARHWLAERLWRIKFGQQQAPAEEDDLVNRSEAELQDVLRNTLKELEAAGFKVDAQNVH